MMLCDADFDEIFAPEIRPRPPVPAPAAMARLPQRPEPGSLARWEDDGGRVSPAPRSHAAPRLVYPANHGYRTAGPALAGMALAMVPAVAAYGAASAVLARYAGTPET